mmetsp:Transcript_19492/g.49087  ORF Transcript_19492/g.49087 Transcript_19492/m.49087 type:complete len:201 (+) Transcript_19492:1041-1643(+)
MGRGPPAIGGGGGPAAERGCARGRAAAHARYRRDATRSGLLLLRLGLLREDAQGGQGAIALAAQHAAGRLLRAHLRRHYPRHGGPDHATAGAAPRLRRSHLGRGAHPVPRRHPRRRLHQVRGQHPAHLRADRRRALRRLRLVLPLRLPDHDLLQRGHALRRPRHRAIRPRRQDAAAELPRVHRLPLPHLRPVILCPTPGR